MQNQKFIGNVIRSSQVATLNPVGSFEKLPLREPITRDREKCRALWV